MSTPQVARINNQPRQGVTIHPVPFNFDTGNYRELIRGIRRKAQEPGRFSHNRPVLRPRSRTVPDEWIDVALTTAGRTLTLRIRCQNLYLDGFRMHNGQWREFNPDDGRTNLIPGSCFLGFSGGYDDLQRDSTRLSSLQISRDRVQTAIIQLAENDAGNQRKAQLMILILVICEAARFEELFDKFVRPLDRFEKVETSVNIDAFMERLIRSWGELSGRLLQADAKVGLGFPLPRTSDLRPTMTSALEAASYVGLLLGSLDFRHPSRLLGGGGGVAAAATVPPGQPMMEIFSFKILGFSTDLSGTITVTDGLGKQVLFDGHQVVRSGDALSLKSLSRAISAWQCAVISYDLIAQDQGSTLYGSESWNIFQTEDSYSADKRSKKLSDGHVELDYKIFPFAWQLGWEVKIVKGEGYDPLNIHGHLTVSYSCAGQNYQIDLFRRTSENNAQVYVGQCIPLSKAVTAVPLYVDLWVGVELWHHVRLHQDPLVMKGIVKHEIGNRLFGDGESGRYSVLKNGRAEISFIWNRVSMD